MKPDGSSSVCSCAPEESDAMTYGSIRVVWVTEGSGFLRTLLIAFSYAVCEIVSPAGAGALGAFAAASD